MEIWNLPQRNWNQFETDIPQLIKAPTVESLEGNVILMGLPVIYRTIK